MIRRISLLLAAAVAAGAVVATAIAGHVNLIDPNDTPGLLDVRRVELDGTKRPRWRVFTFSRWSTEDVFDSGFTLVRLDTFGSPRFDYYALIRSNGFRLRASLWRDRATKRDYKVDGLAVWRPSRASLAVRVPLRKVRIGKRRIAYHWIVETLFTSDKCRSVCIDFAPDAGRIAEPLPVPPPTPTPTPTPSDSATPTPTPSG